MKHEKQQHFSHHHILVPLQLIQGEQISCEACEEIISESQPFHGCLSCQFYLHDLCSEAPRSLDHPSHPSHPLTLLPKPTYSSRMYLCNACGRDGKAYSFSCASCEFDLHVQCAYRPKTIRLDNHPHELSLIFGSPYQNKNTSYSCDVCKEIMNPFNWLYYCGPACDFTAHLGYCRPSNSTPITSPPVAGGQDEIAKVISDSHSHDHEKFANNNIDNNVSSNNPASSRLAEEQSRQEEERLKFEAQRKLRAQRIAQQTVLQGLDAARDYASGGSTYTTRYYYY